MVLRKFMAKSMGTKVMKSMTGKELAKELNIANPVPGNCYNKSTNLDDIYFSTNGGTIQHLSELRNTKANGLGILELVFYNNNSIIVFCRLNGLVNAMSKKQVYFNQGQDNIQRFFEDFLKTLKNWFKIILGEQKILVFFPAQSGRIFLTNQKKHP